MTPLERLIATATTFGATIVDAPGAIVIVVPKGRPADAAELVMLAEAARIAATSIRTVRDAMRASHLPAFGRQRHRSVRRADLEIWLERAGGNRKAQPRRRGAR